MSDRRLTAAVAAALIALVTAGCGSSVGLGSSGGDGSAAASSSSSGTSGMKTMAGMSGSGSVVGASGTSMDAAVAKELKQSGTTRGVKPVPTQMLGTSTWQGMKIMAMAMTPVPFVVSTGTSERTLTPPKDSSFHLMVDLDDSHTGVAIPYATVWARISRDGKPVYNERQWPMLSEYMGPHYGNNVVLPAAGHYRLSLLITPPAAARHIEYAHVWLKPHTVTMDFTWRPPA